MKLKDYRTHPNPKSVMKLKDYRTHPNPKSVMKLKDYRTHPNPNPKHPKSLSDKTREDVIYDVWCVISVWWEKKRLS